MTNLESQIHILEEAQHKCSGRFEKTEQHRLDYRRARLRVLKAWYDSVIKNPEICKQINTPCAKAMRVQGAMQF